MNIDWEKIKAACKSIEDGICNKIEGDGYIVYRVGKVIRIDIK